jgi:hypothetical protein
MTLSDISDLAKDNTKLLWRDFDEFPIPDNTSKIVQALNKLWLQYAENNFISEDVQKFLFGKTYGRSLKPLNFYKFPVYDNLIGENGEIYKTPPDRIYYIPTASDVDRIRRIFKNTKFADINLDHNQALDVLEEAQRQGIAIPKCLINFDSHADFQINSPTAKMFATIGNWINECICRYDVRDVYWVKPMWKPDEEGEGFFIIDKTQGLVFPENSKLESEINQRKLAMAANWQEMSGDSHPRYSTINLHLCTADHLPDFYGRDVFLSIDGDYLSLFSRNGRGSNQDTCDIYERISRILQILIAKNIFPKIVNMTMSIGYVPMGREVQIIKEFFLTCMRKTPQKTDSLFVYCNEDFTKNEIASGLYDNSPKYIGI